MVSNSVSRVIAWSFGMPYCSHFAESIQNENLHFDHKIKPGPLKTKNAIRILEISGFPNEIIFNARSFTKVSGN